MRGHRFRLAILLVLLGGWAVLAAACGGSEATTTTQELSTAGGTAVLGDDVTVHFPPGTLSGPTTVTITRASDENAPPQALEAADAIGDAFKIDIGDQELDGPVTIEFPYAEDALPDGTGNDEIFLAYFDDELDVWVPVAGEVDPERNIIAVQTDHLSWWNPWTWNWDAWMAVLNQTLMLRVTDFFDAVAVLVDDCPQSGTTVTVDASDANNVVQGCVERDDPDRPELRVVNPKSFFFEVSSIQFEPYLLRPAESYRFFANTADNPPLVVSAEVSQAAGVHLVMHLVLQMLPGGSQLLSQNGIVTCLAETLSNLAPIASAVEALVVHRDGAAASEALLELYSNLASAEAFISAADGCGAPVASSWTGTAFGQLATGARVTATIMSATDFVANFLLNSHSEVQFKWTEPTPTPTPIPTMRPPGVEAVSDSYEQQALNRVLRRCREDFLADGFREVEDGLFEGILVSRFGGASTTFQVRDIVFDEVGSEPLSPADRANGIEWQGGVSVSWINRHRLQLGAGDWTDWSNRSAIFGMTKQGDSWIRSTETDSGTLREGYHGCTKNLFFLKQR